jgi:lipid A disaccharide synthetase
LFQSEAKPEELARLGLKYLEEPEASDAMKRRLAGIREQLGARCASEMAAAAVSRYL